MLRRQKFADQGAFTVGGSIFQKLFNLAAFVVLTRTLTAGEIGMIGVSLGYIVLLNYFVVHPEGIMMRRKLEQQDRELSAFLLFWVLRSLVMIGLGIAIGLFLSKKEPLLGRFFIIFAVVNCTNQLGDMLSFTLFMHYRHRLVFFLQSATGALQFFLILLLFYYPGLIYYAWILLTVSLARVAGFFSGIRLCLGFRPDFSGSFAILGKNIFGFSLWNNLNTVTIQALFFLDTVILYFYADLDMIGDYTVALKIAFVSFEMVSLLEKAMCLSFQEMDGRGKDRVMWRYAGLISLSSLALAGGYAILGRFVLTHIFTVRDMAFVYQVGLILLLTVAVINSAKPLQAMIITRCDLRKFFFSITLPTLFVGVGMSLTLTYFLGAMGTAVTKFPVYGFFLAASSWFISTKTEEAMSPSDKPRRYFDPPGF
ncbi:MAG: hypothetical protein AB1585_21740 [Thermodesulfobacteriota bacterium]